MRQLKLGLLCVVVFLLVSVPPLFALRLIGGCGARGDACRDVTAAAWFRGDMAMIWLPPLVLAIVPVWLIFRIKRSIRPA